MWNNVCVISSENPDQIARFHSKLPVQMASSNSKNVTVPCMIKHSHWFRYALLYLEPFRAKWSSVEEWCLAWVTLAIIAIHDGKQVRCTLSIAWVPQHNRWYMPFWSYNTASMWFSWNKSFSIVKCSILIETTPFSVHPNLPYIAYIHFNYFSSGSFQIP